MQPRVTVVLVHFRAPEWCRAAIRSVLASHDVDLSVVVVDNSGDLVVTHPRVTTLRPATNLGYAGGANLGLRHWLEGDGAHCLVASHDLQVGEHTLARLATVAAGRTDFGCLAPWFTPRVARVGELGRDDELVEFEWVSGSAFLWTRECLEQIGLFDEDFGSYVEDKELCLRARAHGWRVGAVLDAPASSRGSAVGDRATVLIHGNEILLAAKSGDRAQVRRLLTGEVTGAGRELRRALSPSASTSSALRRAWLHLRSLGFGLAQTARFTRARRRRDRQD